MNSIWASCTCGGAEENLDNERESVPYQPQALEVNVSKLRQEEEYLREKLDYQPMDSRKVKILTCFKQDHVVDKYDMLKPAQKIRLSNDCELLEMDLIDLNYHNLLIRGLYKIPKAPRLPQNVHNFNSLTGNLVKSMTDKGLKIIAQGKICLIIDATEPSLNLNLSQTKILKKLNLPKKVNFLEFILKRVKSLSDRAIAMYGKLYKTRRDAIMPIIVSNHLDIESVENELIKNNYFGYKGLICFSVGVSPHLFDGRKLILDHENGNVKFGGLGGAAIMQSLKKFKVFDTWKREGIQFVNIVDSSNFNVQACDPFTFAFLTSANPKRQVVIDVIKANPDKKYIENPFILQEEDNSYNGFYPFEISYMNYKNKTNYAIFEVPYVNIFTTTSYLYSMCTKMHLKTFTFRIREENDGFDYTTLVDTKNYKIPGIYRFVQSIFNILKGSDRVSLVEKDPSRMILWKNPVKLRSKRDKKGHNKVTTEIALIKQANEYHRTVVRNFKPDKKQGEKQVDEKDKFLAYLSHYYCPENYLAQLYGGKSLNDSQSFTNHTVVRKKKRSRFGSDKKMNLDTGGGNGTVNKTTRGNSMRIGMKRVKNSKPMRKADIKDDI